VNKWRISDAIDQQLVTLRGKLSAYGRANATGI
jgi:hypothetical protein